MVNWHHSKKMSPNKFSDEDFELASSIFDRVCVVAPKTKPTNLDAWANDIRLMREKDGNSLDEIERVFAFANSPGFWKSHILSTSTLRKKFPTLHAQMINDKARLQPQESQIRSATL